MKKDITMKKTSFLNGAMMMSFAIVLTKIIGILYVIPFHQIIGDEGGALYGYAYTIYLLFISISTAGIPLAMSRVVSEYQALGYYSIKKRAFVLGKRIALLLGFISFIVIMVFAPYMAEWILGDVVGGSSISDVVFVIRIIGIAILIVPTLSIYRGYFEGHRFMGPPSISQVLEQIFRVMVIIFGSYLAISVFKSDLTVAVGIALFGASIGALAAYFYLLNKYLKNRRKFNERVRSVNEPIVSDVSIMKKIFMYAIPFIMIDVFRSVYNYIDMFTVVKALVKYADFSASNAEIIYSMLSTWALKFNMILLAVSSGIVVSLVPNLTEGIVKKDNADVNKKITLSMGTLLYLTIPMTFGISFLAKPIWTLFYGNSTFGPKVLQFYIFVGLFTGIFTCLITILQTFKNYKYVMLCLISGVIVKILLNIKLLKSFSSFGLPPYYGIISATLIGLSFSFIMAIIILHTKYDIKFEKILKNFVDILCASVVMIIVIWLVSFIIPLHSNIRIINLLIILIYSVIGSIVYFSYSRITKLDRNIFGNNNLFTSIKKVIIKK